MTFPSISIILQTILSPYPVISYYYYYYNDDDDDDDEDDDDDDDYH